MYSQGTAPHVSPPPRRRSPRSPNDIVRKDPNAWSLREAVELCKLLEVVLPEAGFHIALTGGLLYKEGRRKDCDLMFYQIRQMEPNYEVLWKYLTVAGVLRSPSYPENGWLVKATYRGKQVDCLFPNAKKAKKAEGTPKCGYNFTPPPPVETTIADALACVQEEAFRPPTPREQALLRNAGIITAPAPILVRHNDGAPILYRRSPDAPGSYDPAELLATPAPAPVPPPTIHAAVAASRIVESAASAFISPPVPQDDIPF